MTDQPTAPRPSSAPRRALGLTLLGGAAGAAVVLIAAGQTWGDGTATAAGAELPVDVSGSAVSGVPSALALVGLAALVAVFAVRRTGRRVVAGLLTLSGAGAVAASLVGSADESALQRSAAEVTGLADATVTGVTHTVWPWISVIGGALLLVAGLLALRYGREWPAMSGRYERGGRRRPGPAERPAGRGETSGTPERPDDLWKALDRGEDPT